MERGVGRGRGAVQHGSRDIIYNEFTSAIFHSIDFMPHCWHPRDFIQYLYKCITPLIAPDLYKPSCNSQALLAQCRLLPRLKGPPKHTAEYHSCTGLGTCQQKVEPFEPGL